MMKTERQLEGPEVEDLLQKSDLFVLDVRSLKEFHQGALEGAKCIPVDELSQRLNELPQEKERTIYVYCAHGVRSVTAKGILEKNGYENVFNLKGGLATFAHYLRHKNA